MFTTKQNLEAVILTLCCLGTLMQPINANPVLTPGIWARINTGTVGCGVAIAQSEPSTIYWCRNGLQKTTDGGATWKTVGPMDVTIDVKVNPLNADQVYCADGVGGSKYGFWKSIDGGATWTQPQGFKDKCADPSVATSDGYSVAVDPSDFNHVLFSFHSPWPDRAGYTYAGGVLESKDGGETWIIHYPVPGMTQPGFDIFFLYSPDLKIGDKNTWLMGCQGAGFWRTSDAGATWTKVNNNDMTHGGSQLYYTKAGVLFAGTSAWPMGPMRSTDNGKTWLASNLNTMYTIGIYGDGTNLYTGPFNGSGPFYTSLETDGINWVPFNGGTQTFQSGPFELDYDSVGHIMYSSSPADGLWALKVSGGTSVAREVVAKPSIDNRGTRSLVLKSGNGRLKVAVRSGAGANRAAIYNVNGKMAGKVASTTK